MGYGGEKTKTTMRYFLIEHCFALGMMRSGHRDSNISWKPNPEGYDPLVSGELIRYFFLLRRITYSILLQPTPKVG